MADIKNLEGMIDSTPIMKDYADIESAKLPQYQIDSKIPEGPIAEKWTNYKAHQKLVNPANKRNLDIIVVGTGLAGASAASTLAELGFNVWNFCIQDSPRRAHSIAAQGGINAAKDYQNDGDSVYRLFYDTVKGGDFRSREANVYRLAEVSNNIIDQCVQQGVPFAREYGGLLANRSFGGAQVSRTFYAKGQTGQQLLLGAYASLNRQIEKGQVRSFNRREMLDVVIIDGRARGIIVRNLITGGIGARYRRLRTHILPFDKRHGLQRLGRCPGFQERRLSCQSRFHPDSPHMYPRSRRRPVETHPYERVAA